MKYPVFKPLTFDGKRYLPGSEVELSKAKKETSDRLLELGVIGKPGTDDEAKAKAEIQKKADDLIKQAIKDGKILPSDEKVWLNSALQDYDATKKTLDAKAKVEAKK